MELKDKLNLVWKFAFLGIFTYGVMALACCSNSCNSSCNKAKQCGQAAPIAKQCGVDCTKACCAK